MNYWLFKSEPSVFSIDDLKAAKDQTTHWEGVRNYTVRNLLRDQIKVNDLAFFYHSSCEQPGITGIMKVVKAGYPDSTAWDQTSRYFDSKSEPTKPIWFRVDVSFVQRFKKTVTLEEIKKNPLLAQMAVARKGNRLSITPVTKPEWQAIMAIVGHW